MPVCIDFTVIDSKEDNMKTSDKIQSPAYTKVISHCKTSYIVSAFFSPPRTQKHAKADMKKIIDNAYNNLTK